jgi:hypothetical protein
MVWMKIFLKHKYIAVIRIICSGRNGMNGKGKHCWAFIIWNIKTSAKCEKNDNEAWFMYENKSSHNKRDLSGAAEE